MIQCQLKLRLNAKQEATLDGWLFHLTAVFNFAVRKIELNAKNKIYFSEFEFLNLLAGHSKRLDVPSDVLRGVLDTVHSAWKRCFKKKAGKPRLKGNRNKLTSIPFPAAIKAPEGNHIRVLGLGKVRFHKMEIPDGKIKCGRIIKRASGWYLCLFIDAAPKKIERVGYGEIGIDPGFKRLLVTSAGEIIEHPRELEASAQRLAQAQRGHDKKLAARIQERIANQKKDRNHKLSHRLVAENVKIVFSKDNIRGIAKRFGKSVASSSHAQLRQMLSSKSPTSGTEYVEVASKNSTRTCYDCRALTGPTGLTGLSVREWRCSDCGSLHDRDVNAARNTLFAGAGYALEENHP